MRRKRQGGGGGHKVAEVAEDTEVAEGETEREGWEAGMDKRSPNRVSMGRIVQLLRPWSTRFRLGS